MSVAPTEAVKSSKVLSSTENDEGRPVEVGVIGASGFVGLRAIEILHGESRWNVRPIVRATSSLAVIARQRFDWRIADLLSHTDLASALIGCSVCIHAAIGDAAQIVRMAEATYRACALAGVKRLVWLSSASVHGQNPDPDTNDDTPLHCNHPVSYNNAKVRAEWSLERLSRNGAVEVVRLRPSVVFGPRSRWISDASDALCRGRSAWVNKGQGFCNTIYIDNLIEAIKLSVIHRKAAGEAFLIGDETIVTWREFLLPIAQYLGLDEDAFLNALPPPITADRENVISMIRNYRAYNVACTKVPDRLKRIVKGMLNGWRIPLVSESEWHLRGRAQRALTMEMVLLQQCKWALSSRKAREILGYKPSVSFSEGMKHSLAWLDFLR